MRPSTTLGAALLVGLASAAAWLSFTESGSRALDSLAIRQVPGHPSHLREPLPNRVLVVGDGTAFGLGVPRESSWPALLRSGSGLDAVDRVAPRLLVRTALRDLPLWLVETRPSLVVVCLGIDEGLVDTESWTTKEVQLLQAWVGSDGVSRGSEGGAKGLVGRWRSASGVLDLRADGTVDFHGVAGLWSVEGGRLEIRRDGVRTVFRWEFVDAFLKLDSDELDLHLSYENEARSRDPLDLTAEALSAGRLTEARVRIEALERAGVAEVASHRAVLDSLVGRSPGTWPETYDTKPAPSTDTCVPDLRAIVGMVRRAGAELLFVGHSPAAEATDRSLRELARSEGVAFLGSPAGGDPSVGTSGPRSAAAPVLENTPLYWSVAGHRALAERVAAAVRRQLAARGR